MLLMSPLIADSAAVLLLMLPLIAVSAASFLLLQPLYADSAEADSAAILLLSYYMKWIVSLFFSIFCHMIQVPVPLFCRKPILLLLASLFSITKSVLPIIRFSPAL